MSNQTFEEKLTNIAIKHSPYSDIPDEANTKDLVQAILSLIEEDVIQADEYEDIYAKGDTEQKQAEENSYRNILRAEQHKLIKGE